MLAWIMNNIWTIIICAALILIVVSIIVSMIRKKRKGKSVVCNCGSCSSCPMSGQCHSK
ncbi:MAG: FeoB-associated Cys-rich membrane protein [Ruminococcus sp.]|nr:FeoB-associated Cys-rich membrane protein [Ruminococcus sp.]